MIKYTNNEIVVRITNNGVIVVTNPLPLENQAVIRGLINRCDLILSNNNKTMEFAVLDIKTNLTNYLTSEDEVWVEYRSSIPFDYINQEFHQRIHELEKTNTLSFYQKISKTLDNAGFNSEFMLQKNAVRFIGSPKKARKVLDSNYPAHNLSIIETDTGGIFVKLGSKFKGKKTITQKEFNTVFKDAIESTPNLSSWITSLLSSTHTFATEDIQPDELEKQIIKTLEEGGDVSSISLPSGASFGGVPTPSKTPVPKPIPSTVSPPSTISTPVNTSDDSDENLAFPAELLYLIQNSKELWPDGTKDTITEQVIILDIRPPPEPDPNPQPPPEPPCIPLWKSQPPDPRMTRIDSYNIVESGRTTAPDGFGWSVSGLTEEKSLFGKTQLVTWPQFTILSGQTGVTRVVTQPSAPEGWFTNETKPQKCSLLRNRKLFRIPSLSYDAVVIGANFISLDPAVNIPEEYRFFRDSADGLYIEVLDYDAVKHSSCTFTVTQAAPPYDSIIDIGGLFGCNLTFKDYKSGKGQQYSNYASENVVLQGSGIADADKVLSKRGLTENSNIGETLTDLYGWLYTWFCEDIPQSKPDMIGEYLRTDAGACRHRAYIMFLALNRLGLPCRMVGSTCHAWSEIWNPDTGAWVQMDLNGCEDPKPDPECESCMVKNQFYNIERDGKLIMCCPEGYKMNNAEDECVSMTDATDTVPPIDCEKCIPKRCPENYYCLNDKCIPDCEKIEGVGWNYHPVKDKCINCSEEGLLLEWSPEDLDCVCIECPDGYNKNEDGDCVDENDVVSNVAPKGYYFDKSVGMQQCMPIEDCSSKVGTVFNIVTGVCECPPIVKIIDGISQEVIQNWDANTGKCADKLVCPQGFKVEYDFILGDYKCVPEQEDIVDPLIQPPLPTLPDDLPSEDKEKEEEDIGGIVINDEAIRRKDASRWIGTKGEILTSTPSNTQNWIISRKQSFRLKGKNPNTRKRWDDVWDWGDLYGAYNWLNTQANKDLISFTEPKEGQYFIAFSLNPDRPQAAEEHFNLWKESIEATKEGLGISQDGAGVKFKPLGGKKVKDFAGKIDNLGFPESSVTLLTISG